MKNIDDAIETLTKKITDDIKGDDALKLTQAALNLAHTAQVLNQVKATK